VGVVWGEGGGCLGQGIDGWAGQGGGRVFLLCAVVGVLGRALVCSLCFLLSKAG
jgi:hypothetical protein